MKARGMCVQDASRYVLSLCVVLSSFLLAKT